MDFLKYWCRYKSTTRYRHRPETHLYNDQGNISGRGMQATRTSHDLTWSKCATARGACIPVLYTAYIYRPGHQGAFLAGACIERCSYPHQYFSCRRWTRHAGAGSSSGRPRARAPQSREPAGPPGQLVSKMVGRGDPCTLCWYSARPSVHAKTTEC